MGKKEEYYGEKIRYDPLWKGPMKVQRNSTDSLFSIIFSIFLVVWVAVACYAYLKGDINSLSDVRNVDFRSDFNHQKNNNAITMEKIFATKYIVLGILILATILVTLYILMLRWFAQCFVYTAVLLICSLLLVSACASAYIYSKDKDNSGALVTLIISAITLSIIVLYFLCFLKEINIACEVIREASKAVIYFPSLYLFPIIVFVLHVIIIAITISVFVYLYAVTRSSSEKTPGYLYVFHFLNIFGLIWIMAFVTALAQMILSGSFATWYWTLNKQHVPHDTVLRVTTTTFRYHLGTVACGSLIVSISQLIKILLETLESILTSQRNPLAFVCCCFKYIFENLIRLIKSLNRNAYIITAVHGTTFCQSAKCAFNLLMRHILKIVTINKVTKAIFFLGQFLVIAISIGITIIYCNAAGMEHLQTAALAVVVIGSYLVTEPPFMVLRIAVDTVFLCVLEDSERNDGSQETPYYMNNKLESLLLR